MLSLEPIEDTIQPIQNPKKSVKTKYSIEKILCPNEYEVKKRVIR